MTGTLDLAMTLASRKKITYLEVFLMCAVIAINVVLFSSIFILVEYTSQRRKVRGMKIKMMELEGRMADEEMPLLAGGVGLGYSTIA